MGAALGVLLLVALAAPFAGAAKDETILVSRQSAADGNAAADDQSFDVAISPDGRFVAFDSDADNLSGANDDGVLNTYVRDLATETTTLISRQSAASGGAGADGESDSPAITPDGRFIAFNSAATNLSGGLNTVRNVYLRDLEAETTTLVSRQSTADGGAGADERAFFPSISADGRFVAFDSFATNLSPDAVGGVRNVYVRDLATETTTLVSRRSASEGGAGGADDSEIAAISADGRFVSFASDADNLSGDDNNAFGNIYVRDLVAETTTLVSRQSAGDGGAGGDEVSFSASISADGGLVAFESRADNLSGADADAVDDVYVRDLEAETTTLVSRQTAAEGGTPGDDDSIRSAISPDGGFVAFDSLAANLSGDDNDGFDVYLRDLEAETTTLVSRQSAADGGAGADAGQSAFPAVSESGRFVAFDSAADNLSDIDDDGDPADDGTGSDVFVRDVLGEQGGDTTPPELELKAKKRQRIDKPVKVKATCDEPCTVVAKAKAKLPSGEKLRLRKATAELASDETEKLRLKASERVERKLKRAGGAKVKVKAAATDAAGNEAEAKARVKLRVRP